ncbi:Bcr/CflA family efflux MFS transporter [bacterium]|nr:Bcr/CflA family efflux MFS transporter [bacterium]
MAQRPSNLFIIFLLGAMSVISPFAIDMYLPAYGVIAKDFDVPSAVIALTLSSYFIGMAIGQVFYGPLLDRFGRKKPLICGLGLFVLASILCAFAPNIQVLIVLRFLQAIGGCVAGVASLAMVRDVFPVNEGARILSRLFLFISVSPLLAPTVGGAIILAFGWKAVFVAMALIVTAIVALIWFQLPETHQPDADISLKPMPILREYLAILQHPRFATYALSGAFSFAGLFTYVAGSPIIFMENFHLSAQAYSMVFGLLAMGFIGGSQLNAHLLKKYDSETIFNRILFLQAATGCVFMLGMAAGWYGLAGTLVLFFIFLSCTGLTYPNAAAIALAPFSKNAGSASALLGFLQLGTGAVISTGISLSDSRDSFPIIAILGVTSLLGLITVRLGRRRAMASPVSE